MKSQVRFGVKEISDILASLRGQLWEVANSFATQKKS